ncbi:hypothetical protein C0993_002062, partial [Termitomyces sp. T159_Od127]
SGNTNPARSAGYARASRSTPSTASAASSRRASAPPRSALCPSSAAPTWKCHTSTAAGAQASTSACACSPPAWAASRGPRRTRSPSRASRMARRESSSSSRRPGSGHSACTIWLNPAGSQRRARSAASESSSRAPT